MIISASECREAMTTSKSTKLVSIGTCRRAIEAVAQAAAAFLRPALAVMRVKPEITKNGIIDVVHRSEGLSSAKSGSIMVMSL